LFFLMKMGWSLINSERYFFFRLIPCMEKKVVLLVCYIRFKARLTFHLVFATSIHLMFSFFVQSSSSASVECRYGKERGRQKKKRDILFPTSQTYFPILFNLIHWQVCLISTRKFWIIKCDPAPRISFVLFYLFSMSPKAKDLRRPILCLLQSAMFRYVHEGATLLIASGQK